MRGKRAFYNMISSAIYEVVLIVTGLILPRLYLKAFGSYNNGLISSISQFLNYISFLTIGVAGPTRVALYKTLSKNDLQQTNAVLSATHIFYRKISLIFLSYVAVLMAVFPFIVDHQLAWYEVSLLIAVISIGTMSDYLFGVTYTTFLSANQNTYIYTIIKIINRIMSTAIIITMIKIGYSLIYVQLMISLFNAIPSIAVCIIVKKKYSIDLSVEPDNTVFRQRKDAAASSIANIVHDKTDIFMLTLFTTTAYVSVYSIYMIVMNGLLQIMRVFTNTLEAPFGNMFAKHEIDVIRRNLCLYEHLIYSFVAVAFCSAAILLMPFIKLYTSGVYDINYIRPMFASLLIIATALQCVRQPYLTMVQAAGKYKENKVGNYIEAGLNIALSLLLVKPYGLVGVTIGTIAANAFRTGLYMLYTSNKLLDRSVLKALKRLLWLSATAIVIISLYKILPFTVACTTWTEWIVSACLVSVFVGNVVIVSGFLFFRDDSIELLRLINRIVRR